MSAATAPPPTAGRPPSAADKPMTRRGCLIGLAAWLVIVTLPICALLLAVRGELAWRRGPFVEDRVWLVSLDGGPGEERASGLAYSAARVVSGRTTPDEPVCVRTRVYFLLWRGHSEALEYCECYQAAANGDYEALGQCAG